MKGWNMHGWMIAMALFAWASSAVAAEFHLPFNDRWFVMQGGDTPNVNHHMLVRVQAYGVDFARVAGASGRELARGSASSAEDFYSWHEQVFSPVNGVIFTTDDSLPDNPLGQHDVARPLG